MKRRRFLQNTLLTTGTLLLPRWPSLAAAPVETLSPDLAKDWLSRWEQHIVGETNHRYCDTETGEELAWLLSPFLDGFYYGYKATNNAHWVERLVDWADAWIARAVKEPDGYVGWPKAGTGGALAKEFFTDSLLGEAMAFRPVVLMAGEIQRDPELKARFADKASRYLKLAGETFEKWIARGCWREISGGGVWVVPAFGIDQQTGKWTDGYAQRHTEGLSHPDNKQNHIARWLMALYDVSHKPVYQETARKWWQIMKSRMHTREGGKYCVWNYWEPAGPWDYNPDGTTRHWVGVHPNGGYYQIDIEGIVCAFKHELVFSKTDIDRLVATNRDFMWNQQLHGARFGRIDGGETDARWKESAGTLWTALVPYDETLRKIFLANNDPASWSGLIATPWFLAEAKRS